MQSNWQILCILKYVSGPLTIILLVEINRDKNKIHHFQLDGEPIELTIFFRLLQVIIDEVSK